MNTVLKIFLSMSFSGGLLILALLLGKRFLKDKISRQWQYYIWLVVVLRLLPQAAPLPSQRPAANSSGDISAPAVGLEQGRENGSSPAEDLTTVHPLQEIWVLLTNHVWLVWLVAALGLLIRKATVYDRQVFKSR